MTTSIATASQHSPADELSKLRLYAMKFVYLATFLSLGYAAWHKIVTQQELWDPLHGVAYSFWAAYAVLMLLGVMHPLKMLPLLLLQLLYKAVWIAGVAFPPWSAGHLDPATADLLGRFSFAVIMDLIVIPWPYVWANYLRKSSIR